MLAELKFIKILDNYIILKILPVDFKAVKSDFVIKHYFDLENSYDINSIDTTENIYEIKFTRNISLSDFFIIYLKRDADISNTINISVCRSVFNGSTVIPYDSSHISSGEYTISLTTLNDLPLENVTTNFVFCDGIDTTKSLISTDKDSYLVNEDINLNVTLFDSNGIKAPNGNYIIKITIEKE